ncbi:hypothetical protein U1Q18_051590 [Sarracenia purpurea var. burkii]
MASITHHHYDQHHGQRQHRGAEACRGCRSGSPRGERGRAHQGCCCCCLPGCRGGGAAGGAGGGAQEARGAAQEQGAQGRCYRGRTHRRRMLPRRRLPSVCGSARRRLRLSLKRKRPVAEEEEEQPQEEKEAEKTKKKRRPRSVDATVAAQRTIQAKTLFQRKRTVELDDQLLPRQGDRAVQDPVVGADGADGQRQCGRRAEAGRVQPAARVQGQADADAADGRLCAVLCLHQPAAVHEMLQEERRLGRQRPDVSTVQTRRKQEICSTGGASGAGAGGAARGATLAGGLGVLPPALPHQRGSAADAAVSDRLATPQAPGQGAVQQGRAGEHRCRRVVHADALAALVGAVARRLLGRLVGRAAADQQQLDGVHHPAADHGAAIAAMWIVFHHWTVRSRDVEKERTARQEARANRDKMSEMLAHFLDAQQQQFRALPPYAYAPLPSPPPQKLE